MIRKAFMLGAGLGTRLRPLTDLLPKPLVPLFHKPLIEWAMESCEAAGIDTFAINTHHLPEKWLEWGDQPSTEESSKKGANGMPCRSTKWNGHPVDLFHEPLLLETGGGIKNISSWIGSDDVLVHNGDIYSSIALDQLIDAHESNDCVVTLALRSHGAAQHIALDGDHVVDIRGMLDGKKGTHQFTGIYCLSPELLELIPEQESVSVIPAFLELAKRNKLGAIVLDQGEWFDLGDPESYLMAHQNLNLAPAIHSSAEIENSSTIRNSVVGPSAKIAGECSIINSVVWPDVSVQSGTVAESAILTGH